MKIKLLIILLFAVTLIAVFYSCDPAVTDTGTIKNYIFEDTFAEKFQEGLFPTTYYKNTRDTSITSADISSDNGNSTFGEIGTTFTTVIDKSRFLIKFDIGGYIPKGAIIKKASLILYIIPMSGLERVQLISSVPTITSEKGVYELTKNFVEGDIAIDNDEASWNTFDGFSPWTTPGGDFNTGLISNKLTLTDLSFTDYYTFYINASAVQKWLDTPEMNYGMIIKNIKEDQTNDVIARVYTNESNDFFQGPNLRPMFIVYYSLP